MEEKLVNILNEMAECLSIAQMKRLQEVLLKNLCETMAPKTEISNTEYLHMFLDAKKIEGCSERTLQYYRITVEKMLQNIDTPIRKITKTVGQWQPGRLIKECRSSRCRRFLDTHKLIQRNMRL